MDIYESENVRRTFRLLLRIFGKDILTLIYQFKIFSVYRPKITNLLQGTFNLSGLFYDTDVKTIIISSVDLTVIYGTLMNFSGRLIIKDCPKLTIIGNYFMEKSKLRSFILENTPNLKVIGDSFLSECLNLKSVKINGVLNVTTLNTKFLYKCHSLTKLDMTSFINVKTIGNRFMCWASSLQHIDIHTFRNVETIGTYFLAHTVSLNSLDLAAFINLTNVGEGFLSGSKALVH